MLDEYDSVLDFGLPRLGFHLWFLCSSQSAQSCTKCVHKVPLYTTQPTSGTHPKVVCAEILQTETIVWDPNDKCRKDKKKLNDAWERIRDSFGGSVPIKELKKKKESLFATYRGYCRKIQASLKSGASVDNVYRPVWFAFDFINSFLGSVFKYKQTIAMDEETGAMEENNSSKGVKSKDLNKPSQTRTTIRRCDNPPELQIASKQMTEAFNNLNKILSKSKYSNEVEDECDVFGKLIIKKLKKLPERKREDIMFDIHALFQKSRFDRSPSDDESFRSSTPKSTRSHNSLTHSLSSNKQPKSENISSDDNSHKNEAYYEY